METKVSRRQLITMLGTVAGAGAAGTLLAHAEAPAVSKPGSLLSRRRGLISRWSRRR